MATRRRGTGNGLFRGDGHRDAGDFDIDRAEMVAAGEIERLPIVAAKGNVGGGGSSVHDAAELFALGIHDPDAAGAPTIDVAFGIHLHAVGDPGLGAAQIGEHAVALPGERAVGVQVERSDQSAARIIDVEDALVRREGETVGHDEIVDQQGQSAQIGGYPIDSGESQIPLLRRIGRPKRFERRFWKSSISRSGSQRVSVLIMVVCFLSFRPFSFLYVTIGHTCLKSRYLKLPF